MFLIAVAAMALGPFEVDELKWRAQYESSLTDWLTVAGLFWLNEGDTTVGSDKTSGVVLPSYAPSSFGTLVRTGNEVTLKRPGQPDEVLYSESKKVNYDVNVGDARFVIIRRGQRIGVRLWDPHSRAIREFTGTKWFPVSDRYLVKARFIPYSPARTLKILDVLGDVSDSPCPGYIEFQMDGQDCKLDAQGGGGGLFFNFQDSTTNKETYGAGRFLDTQGPKDGWVMVDFNRATNPPCAFTSFATCPLPPKNNRLPVAIRAGEWAHHAE